MKKNINDLIADYIVEVGIEETMSFNRTIYLSELENDLSEELIDYIKNNSSEIAESIRKNEKVAELDFEDRECGFDMVFYWYYCLNNCGKDIQDRLNERDIDVEFEDVVELGNELYDYDIKNRSLFIDQCIDKYLKKDEKELS